MNYETKRQALLDEAAEVIEADDVDLVRFEQIEGEVEALDKLQLMSTAAPAGIDNSGAASAGQLKARSHGLTAHINPITTTDTDVSQAALRSLEDLSTSGSVHAVEAAEALEPMVRSNAKLADEVATTASAEYTGAFVRHLQGNDTAADRDILTRAMAAYGTDAVGGQMVAPVALDPSIIITAGDQTFSDVLRLATKKTLRFSNVHEATTTAGVSISWDAEATEVSDDAPTDLAGKQIGLHKMAGSIPMSIEFLGDVPNAVGEMSKVLNHAAAKNMAVKVMTGTGSGEPEGILTGLIAASSTVDTDTATTLDPDDVWDLFHTELPVAYRRNASGIASDAMWATIRRFGTTDPNFTLDASAGNGSLTLFGKPTYSDDAMADDAATATNNLLIAGDIAETYTVVTKASGGTVMELIPHKFGVNGRPTGERILYFYTRVGAGVVNTNAARVLRAAA